MSECGVIGLSESNSWKNSPAALAFPNDKRVKMLARFSDDACRAFGQVLKTKMMPFRQVCWSDVHNGMLTITGFSP